jgi:hypothetical protein
MEGTMVDEGKILERIRLLLNKANDPAVGDAEREAFLAEANRRMANHAIDQAMLDATRTSGEKRKPTSKHIRLFDSEFQWSGYFYGLIGRLAEISRCRVAWHSSWHEITIVGMQEDVDWAEMLWLQVFLDFSSKISPRWNGELSLAENIFNFKHAGYKWKDIWEIGNRKHPGGMPDKGYQFVPNKCGYMKTMYHRECKARDVSPVGTQTFEAYKMTFTSYFVHRVNARLEEMAEVSKEEQCKTSGSDLALFDVSKLIDEEFYLQFPTLHPDEQARREAASREAAKRAEENDAKYLASLSPEARKRELTARADAERARAKADAKYYRSAKRTYDAVGATAGDQAGSKVNLTRSGRAAEAATARKELS